MRLHTARLLAVLVVLPGCGASYQPPAPKTFARQDQAGTTNIAVLSVDTWDDYVSELQPSYKITEQKALDEIDTVRRSVESTFIDALATGIALAPPTTGTTSSATTTQTRSDAQAIADGTETSSSSQQLDQTLTETEEEAPGDVSAITLPSGVADRATTPTLAASPPAIGGLEPMLKYQAATALFQEIKLLSWYLKKAVQRENFVPYVVRANITVTPRARNEPYDTYLNLSFFSEETPSAAAGDATEQSLIQRFIERADPRKPTGEAYAAEELPESLKRAARADTPFVIPLLVTDSLESTIHTNVVDQVRQFAFSLLFLVKGFGGQGEFERFRRNLERTSGRDLNSLMTVSRLSDNTYRVRLGAMQQVATSHSTIPRNHFITFLLLVPCGVQNVTVASIADWVHAETGLSLEPRPPQVLVARVLEIAAEFERAGFVLPGRAQDFANELYGVHLNNYQEFRAALDRSPNVIGKTEFSFYGKLWVDLSALLEGDRYAETNFQLPAGLPTRFTTRRAVVLDDGAASRVTVRGAALKQQKIVATLEAVDKKNPGKVFPLDASAVAVSTNRDQATLSFPSIKKLADANAGLDLSPSSLEVVCVSCGKAYCGTAASTCTADADAEADPDSDEPPAVATTTNDVCQKIDVAYLKTKKPEVEPGFTLTVTDAAVITDESGRGTLRIAVKIAGEDKGKKKCDKIGLGVEGAGVADVSADPATMLDPKSKTVTVVGSGALTLDLTNLTPVLPTITVGGKCVAGDGKGASVPDIRLQAVIDPRWASGRQPAGGAP